MKTQITILVILVAAMVAAAPLGTEFTYQGVLSDAGSPSSGPFDFRFLIYNADVGGSQVGIIVYVEDLAVADGRFTTQLDFGSIFDGTALWLEVGVRDGASGGAYTVLQPRQELTAAPFSQHSQTADSADTAGHATTAGSATTAGDADTVDGQHGAYYLTWSNFVGIPGDLADGDDDTLGDLSCSSDEIARWNGSAWNCSGDDDTPYARTYVVGPVGTTTENGTALRNAITAIPPPTDQEGAVLLVLEPGTYDVGDTALPIWGWMAIEGAGERLTVITGAACSGATRAGTIHIESDYSGLRQLGVRNTCAATNAVGLEIEGDRALVEHVEVIVSGGANTNTGVHNTGDYLRIDNVAVKAAFGVMQNTALLNSGLAAELVGITALAQFGSLSCRAVVNSGDSLLMQHSTLDASGGSTSTVAFYNTGGFFLLEDVTAKGFAGNDNTRGVVSFNLGTFDDVRVNSYIAIELRSTSTGETFWMKDVEVSGSHQGVLCDAGDAAIALIIDDSWILGSNDAAVVNVAGAFDCHVTIRDSYLAGSSGGVSGTALCVATWDDSTFYTNTCP